MRLPTPNDRQRALAGGHDTSHAEGLETGLSVASYPLGGIVAYGLIGWLIGRAIHASWLLPAGMILGLAIGTAYVIYRYGTQAGSERASAARAKTTAKATAKTTAKATAQAEAKAAAKTTAKAATAKAMAKTGQSPAALKLADLRSTTSASTTPRRETDR
jgi:F0F1-type ATP synthase assembly protein I